MIIGLNGAKGSGKDTVGAFLVEKYGFERLSFAKKLKDSAAALFGVDPELWEKWKNDPYVRVIIAQPEGWDSDPGDFIIEHEYLVNISVREFLQRYGTEAHRDIFGQNFWVENAFIETEFNVDNIINSREHVVITDARFINELEKIRELQGKVVRIERPELESDDAHVSESDPPAELIDHVIVNAGTKDDLYAMVDSLMEELGIQTFQRP